MLRRYEAELESLYPQLDAAFEQLSSISADSLGQLLPFAVGEEESLVGRGLDSLSALRFVKEIESKFEVSPLNFRSAFRPASCLTLMSI